MSRSRRKCLYITPLGQSYPADNERAARSARRTMKQYIGKCWDNEEFILPALRECPHNDLYSWKMDEEKIYKSPRGEKYNWPWVTWERDYDEWYAKMLRKK